MANYSGDQSLKPFVLLVEDEAMVATFLIGALDYLGFQAEHCESAELALHSIVRRLPDLVLTDCNLIGGSSGADLIEDIRLKFPRVPIIGMSGEHLNGRSMLEAGANDFLEKPLDFQVLHEALVPYLDVSSAA